MRKLVQRVGRLQTDVAEALLDQLVLTAGTQLGQPQAAAQHVPDAEELVERGEWILEHRLDVAPVGAQFAARDVRDVLAQVGDGAAGHRHQPQQHAGQGGLARTGLPHHGKHLAGAEVDADVVDSGDLATGHLELLGHVAGREHRSAGVGRDGGRCRVAHAWVTSIGTVWRGCSCAHQQANWWSPSERVAGSLAEQTSMANAQRG